MTEPGRTPSPDRPGEDSERQRLLAAHREASALFAHRLRVHAGAGPRDYLKRRGFEAAIRSPLWDLGYAPSTWTELTQHLRSRGFTDSEICASGLGLRTRRGSVVDRFRDRVMFGVRDLEGQTLGFIGRAAPGAEGAPKYLNSPRTRLYDKSATLFGLHDQQLQLEAGGAPVVVEGPLDAIAVHIAGSVAKPMVGVSPCGTALTEAHVRALSGASRAPLLVAFDADAAGTSAASRAYANLACFSDDAEAVRLPPGADPASLLAEGGVSGLRLALARSAPLVDVVIDEVLSHYSHRLNNAEARLCALREVAPIVAVLPPRQMAHQAARLSSLLVLDHRTVARELTEALSPADLRPQVRGALGYPQVRPTAGLGYTNAGELENHRAVGGPSR